MLNGVMLLWFLLTAAAVLFVAIDIRRTPASPVLKWGFILLTAYTGPIGAFLYVLGCREPLSGLHERYTSIRWRQVLGSTMHCVAGDGVGILAGAVIAAFLALSRPVDLAVEYVLGFGFGWTIFQALFMRDLVGGSYRRALTRTFIPELLSMNLLMAGMLPIAALARVAIAEPLSPLSPDFWFVMSMALLAGFMTAYPINWWLVATGLKHGMTTVSPPETKQATLHRTGNRSAQAASNEPVSRSGSPDDRPAGHDSAPSPAQIMWMSALSIVLFGLGVGLAMLLEGPWRPWP
jgi:hypothetical protein